MCENLGPLWEKNQGAWEVWRIWGFFHSRLLASKEMRKFGLRMLWGSPVSSLLSFCDNQQIQSDVNWVPYLLKPRPKWDWIRDTLFQGDRGMEAGCAQALPHQSLRLVLSSCSYDPGSYLQVLFLNTDGSTFSWILGPHQYPSTQFLFSL